MTVDWLPLLRLDWANLLIALFGTPVSATKPKADLMGEYGVHSLITAARYRGGRLQESSAPLLREELPAAMRSTYDAASFAGVRKGRPAFSEKHEFGFAGARAVN
jgi:hypothetical protein